MPQYVEVNGNTIEFPDGMAAPDIEKAIKANYLSIKPAAAVSAGQEVNSIGRQAGLTARYGLEGLANTAQIVTEPIRNAFNSLRGAAPMQGDSGYQSPLMMDRKAAVPTRPLGEVATSAADAIGLPTPRGANERVVGDAARLMAGTGGLAGTAQLAARAPGLIGQAGQFLAQNIPGQVGASAGAGLAGGASREAGGSPLQQGVAALAGSVAGGMTPTAVQSTMNAGRNIYRGITGGQPTQQLDAQISILMERSGLDYSQVPERVRQSLRQDLSQALSTGQELDPQAVRRLADFRMTGLTPTRGAITQDPVQITREMNLAKTGANSADGQLQGLARIQNQNNARLIQNLNDAGARNGDPFRAGQASIGSIQAADNAMERNVSSLYQQARDTAGRPAPLDGHAFTTRANQALDEALLGGALPESVATHLNRIARGEVPFTVDYAEQLKTAMGNLQRATNDGQTRMALSVVRRALDETPLMPAPTVNPGNMPAIAGTVPPSPATLGQQSIDAFNQARQAARERFAWQESGRPIEAAVNGAQPDHFVRQFVINGTVDDAATLARNLPEGARNEVRSAILAHVKERALGGAADEVGKVSQSAFNKALNAIGDRKLSLFFTPEELHAIRANARVASYVQVQPVGSAVNNSNTAAMLIGKGLDALGGFANAVPVVGPMIAQPLTSGIRNLNVAIQTQRAQNVLPGLLAEQARPPFRQSLLLPGAAIGGLLAAPSAP